MKTTKLLLPVLISFALVGACSSENSAKAVGDFQSELTEDIDKKAKERFGIDESSNKAAENTTKSIKSLSDQSADAKNK